MYSRDTNVCFVDCFANVKSHLESWDEAHSIFYIALIRDIFITISNLIGDRDIGEVIGMVGMFLPLFCVVGLETSNGLMPAAKELIVPGVEHAMLNIVVNSYLFVLRPRGSMVLQVSRIMSAPGLLWNTPTPPVRWWETLKGSIFGVKPSIPALRGPGGGFVVATAEKASWALSLTISSVVSS